MSLHYLVKLEMPVAHVRTLSCYRKKLQNLSHLNCVLQIRRVYRICRCEVLICVAGLVEPWQFRPKSSVSSIQPAVHPDTNVWPQDWRTTVRDRWYACFVPLPILL